MIEILASIFVVYICLKIFIDVQEFRFIEKTKTDKAVILDDANYIKAANYKQSSKRLDIFVSFVEVIMFVFWFAYGLRFLDEILTIENQMLKTIVFINVFIILGSIISLPFEVYKTFKLDKKYGFSTITTKLYIADKIKGLFLSLIFGSIIIAIVSYIITTEPLWWLYSFVAIFTIIIFINAIYPTLIAPMFNKFKTLENEDLKSSIEALLKQAGLKTNGVFSIDASKRDNRLNAYFGGLGKSKRVVLFDTLIEKLTKNELLAVLGHELGHFKHKDIIKNIVMMGIMMFMMFFLLGNIPDLLFVELHLEKSAHTLIALFLLLSGVISFFILPIVSYVSRQNEYGADEYASEVVSSSDLANALIKLANENISYPLSHKLTIAFYHSHPPLVERLRALGKEF